MFASKVVSFKKAAVAIALLSSPFMVNAADVAANGCKPGLIQTRTDFPQRSQDQGEYGDVTLLVKVGADGRASSVAVHKTSGFVALDKAAVESVTKHWRFSVGHCSPEQLELSYDVDVRYEQPVRYTLANSIDWKAVARAKKLANDDQCFVSSNDIDTKVFTCRSATKEGSLNADLGSEVAAK
jgi:TonB family protein